MTKHRSILRMPAEIHQEFLGKFLNFPIASRWKQLADVVYGLSKNDPKENEVQGILEESKESLDEFLN